MENNDKFFSLPPQGDSFKALFGYFWAHGVGNSLDRQGDPMPWTMARFEHAVTDIGWSISQRSVEKWRSGRVTPSRRNLHKIARIAGCGDDDRKRLWAEAFIASTRQPPTQDRRAPVEGAEEVRAAKTESMPSIAERSAPTRRRRVRFASMAGVALLLGALGLYAMQSEPDPTATATASVPTAFIGVNTLTNKTDDAAGDYLLSGLRGDLGYALSQLDDVTYVTPRELSAARELTTDPRGREAKYLISGTLSQDGPRRLLDLRLNDVPDGRLLWAREFDIGFFSVSEINRSVLSDLGFNLGLSIPPEDLAQIVNYGTSNAQSHEAYLKGRFLLKSWHETRTGETIWQANQHFEDALALDPEFGLAAFHSGDAYYHLATRDVAPPTSEPALNARDALERIRTAMRQAGRSARTPAQLSQARVNQIFFSDDWTGLSETARSFGHDAQRDRGELEWFFGPVALLFTGTTDDMDTLVDNRMARFDPLNGTVHAYKARAHLLAGDFETTAALLDAASVGSFSNRIAETRGYLLVATEDADMLSRHVSTATELSPAHRDYFAAILEHLNGNPPEAKRKLLSSTALKEERVHLAVGLAQIGLTDLSFQRFSELEADPLGVQITAIATAYGLGCGKTAIPYGPAFRSRLRESDLELPECIADVSEP